MDTSCNLITVGILGCGAIALNKHLPAILSDPTIQIKAFYNRSISGASASLQQFRQTQAYATDSLEKVLSDKTIDAVCVCLPNSMHSEVSIAAMNAGKHVLCEKPMACNYADALNMCRTSKLTNRVLSIGYQNRWSENCLYVKELCESGYFGTIYHIDAEYMRSRAIPNWGSFTNKELQGGGALLDVGSHVIDLALWFLNEYTIEAVLGKTYNYIGKLGSDCNRWGAWDAENFELDDSAFGTVLMNSGATINLRISWAANTISSSTYKITILGSKAGAILTPESLEIINESKGRMLHSTVDPVTSISSKYTPQISLKTPAQREWDTFSAAVRSGSSENGNCLQALTVSKIIDDLYNT